MFRRLTLSWRANEFIPVAEKFYSRIEKVLQQKFFYKKAILKLISSTDELNFWKQKQNEAELADYISLEKPDEVISAQLKSILAVGKINHSAYLNIPPLQCEWKKFLLEKKSFRNEQFKFEELVVNENYVEWKGEKFDRVIFCEGISAAQNPYLPEIPFQLSKGEMLLIESDKLSQEFILNKEIYILPIGGNRFKAGSTYNWNFENGEASDEGKNYLAGELEKILAVDFKIISHTAAIRPTVKERRPIIGFVKNKTIVNEKSPLAVLNGLGTKGVMLAPFFAQQLAQ